MESLKERWKKALKDPAWWATIFLFVMIAAIIAKFKI